MQLKLNLASVPQNLDAMTVTMHQKQKGHLQPFDLVTLQRIITIQSDRSSTYTV